MSDEMIERVARAICTKLWARESFPDSHEEAEPYFWAAHAALEASGHTALLEDNERLYAWLADTQMLAFKWMEAHDKLKAGKPYEFPKPADLPERVAALLREIDVLREGFRRILKFTDLEMEDGDAARDVARAALSRPLAERE